MSKVGTKSVHLAHARHTQSNDEIGVPSFHYGTLKFSTTSTSEEIGSPQLHCGTCKFSTKSTSQN